MSRAVCPSAFIRLAVATWLGSATFFRRPNLVPFARDIARLSAVRSFTSSRSYSARDPKTPIIMRPAAVDESIPSVVEYQGDAAIGQSLDGFQDVKGIAAQSVQLPHHDGVAIANVIESAARPGRSSLAPDMVSEKVFVTPAAARAAFC